MDATPLNRDLASDFDDAVRWQMEIVAGIVGVAGEDDEQPVLPERHALVAEGPDIAPRQEV